MILSIVSIVLVACQETEKVKYYSVPGVKPAADFIDMRDQRVYKCIEIGDQIWFAENLAYKLAEGDNNMGCRTFGESFLSMPFEEVNIPNEMLVEKLNEEIENGILEDVYYEMFGTKIYAKDMVAEFLLMYGMPLSEVIVYCRDYYSWPEIAAALERYQKELPAAVVAESMAEQMEKTERSNGHYSETYGLLYSYEAALASVPTEGGWRLPTDEDWKKLERYIGMEKEEVDRDNTWRGTTEGALLKKGEHGIGFDALYGGGKLYTPNYSNWTDNDTYTKKDENAFFWTSEKIADTDSTSLGVIRSVAVYSEKILRTTTKIINEDGHPVLYNVRLVKDKN